MGEHTASGYSYQTEADCVISPTARVEGQGEGRGGGGSVHAAVCCCKERSLSRYHVFRIHLTTASSCGVVCNAHGKIVMKSGASGATGFQLRREVQGHLKYPV